MIAREEDLSHGRHGRDRKGAEPSIRDGIDPDRLREAIDKRNRTVDQMTQLIDKQKAAQQAIIDKMR